MKLLIDMNLSPLWVKFLLESGFDSAHGSELGAPTAPDTKRLNYASANALIVFKHDMGFGALLADTQARRPSVIQIRTQNVLPAAMGDALIRVLRTCRTHLEAGALVTVDLNRHRIRVLPI